MLERYRLNELGAEERAKVEAALASDATLKVRLEALETDDRAVLAAHPPARVAASIRARAEAEVAPRRSFFPVLAAVAAAAVVGVVVISQPVEDEVRFKGDGPSLHLFRLVEGTPEKLADGAKVKPRDVVQVAFELSGARHLVVVSVDGAGQATRHWPASDDTTAPAAFKRLPQSFELDDAPGFERFFLVTSDTPLDVKALLASARRAGRVGTFEAPAATQVRSFLLDKATP
jgi:hypothetical protein